tara:strand:- start:198 stop:707 length:510 start_codon:yes stop_codon:yes gene_type:complete
MNEKWKLIDKYEDGYSVSNLGAVYSLRSHKELSKSGGRRGYVRVNLRNADGVSTKQVARLVAKAFLDGFKEELEVDHISGNTTDNRVINLRMVTKAGNGRSFQRPTKNATSKYRGVHFDSRRNNPWVAQIAPGGDHYSLGSFRTEVEAAEAYNDAAIKFEYNKEALNVI